MPKRSYGSSWKSRRAKQRRRFNNRPIRSARRGYYRVPGRSVGALVTMPERKYFDSLLSNSALTASTNWAGTEHDPTTLNTLVCPTQGSQINNRIGRKIAVHKIKIRGIISVASQADQTSLDQAATVRMILAQDKQTNGTQMQGEELMQAPATATAGLANQTFQSLANFGRFRVLKDLSIKLEQPTAAADGAVSNLFDAGGYTKPFKISVSFRKPVVVHFNSSNGGAGDGDVGDIVDNSFHLIAQATAIATAPAITYNCRAVYTDA